MNGYNLTRRFFDWAFSHRADFKPTVSALYFYLIEVCNKLGWKPEFSISAKECMEGMGVSGYNTYKQAFDILCEHGFIKVLKKSCNSYQANIITLLNFDRVTDEVTNKVTDRVSDEVTNKAPTEYERSNEQSNGDIHKTYKTNKTIKTNSRNIEKQKNSYAEFVTLTSDEYSKLVEEFGENATKRMIQILDNYKGANGKKYKSDYRAILNWVVDKYNEESQKSGSKGNKYLSNTHDSVLDGNSGHRGFRDTL